MNSYEEILNMERGRTLNYGMSVKDVQSEACPVCGSFSWDYLLRDKFGDCVGCDDCLKKIYS